MDAERILAFRLARSGLAARSVAGLAEAAACPASDFTRDAALLALSARCEGVSRERYERATDAGAEVGEAPPGAEAVRRFLGFYGPASAGDFADWAGVAKSHAEHLWREVEGELSEVAVGKQRLWLLARDAGRLDSPPRAEGVRLIPPGIRTYRSPTGHCSRRPPSFAGGCFARWRVPGRC